MEMQLMFGTNTWHTIVCELHKITGKMSNKTDIKFYILNLTVNCYIMP